MLLEFMYKKFMSKVIIRPRTVTVSLALTATEPLGWLYLKGSAVNHHEYFKRSDDLKS